MWRMEATWSNIIIMIYLLDEHDLFQMKSIYKELLSYLNCVAEIHEL